MESKHGFVIGSPLKSGYSVRTNNQKKHNMDPSNLIIWAVFLGVALLVFASVTGADDWFKSLVGKSKRQDLEDKVAKLEKRLDDLDKK
jgi:sensor domain CHASE-containing protein